MKKVLLFLLTFLPLVAEAQFTGTGFYRAQNRDSKRYLVIVDNKSAGRIGNAGVDVKLLKAMKPFDKYVVSNPGSVCYIEQVSKSGSTYTCNLSAQGRTLSSKSGMALKLQGTADAKVYKLTGSKDGYSAIISDAYDDEDGEEITDLQVAEGDRPFWNILPITSSSDCYFGVKGEVAAGDGKQWTSMYAAFAFQPDNASNTKAYTVSKIQGGCALLKEATGIVPKNTPVLFCCTSGAAADNKLTLYGSGGNSVGDNLLGGVYFCNDVKDSETSVVKHRNVTYYDEETMRVLGVDSKGKPAFVKGTAENLVVGTKKGGEEGKLFLPANKAYLVVPAGSPDVIRIVMSEDELPVEAPVVQETTVSPSTTAVVGSSTTTDNVTISLSASDEVNASEGSVTLTTAVTEEAIETLIAEAAPGSPAFNEQFNGIYFEKAGGEGYVDIEFETQGDYVLAVKNGDESVLTFSSPEKVTERIEYAIESNEYTMLFAAVDDASAPAARRAPGDGGLKIYSLTIVPTVVNLGIENVIMSSGRSMKSSHIYDLQGRRVTAPKRGLYIVNGRKVVVK